VFVFDSCVKKIPYKPGKGSLRRVDPGVHVPASSTIFKLVEKVLTAGSSLDKECSKQKATLTGSL
jgi:hypothetical protein